MLLLTNIKVQSNRPYVTSDLRKLIRQHDYLTGKANKTGSLYLRQAFNQLRTKVTKNYIRPGKIIIKKNSTNKWP